MLAVATDSAMLLVCQTTPAASVACALLSPAIDSELQREAGICLWSRTARSLGYHM